jgi:hypothetical protein
MRILRRCLLLSIFAVASALAEDTNTSITINGVTYQDYRWGTVTPTTVSVFHRGGVATIPLEVLSPELQKRFGYRPVDAPAGRPATSGSKVKLKFVKVDSEETNSQDGYGENAVDGNPNTYWHTQWHGNSPGLPHEIIIELIPPSVIKGFTYLPRQDESDHGTIKDYEFYVSDDGKNFGQPVKKGTFEPGREEKVETFAPIKCRFIKLKAISEINGLPWTSAAEIGVIQSGENTDLMPATRIADYICTVADDFIVDVYHNGKIVPDDQRRLLFEIFGATAERIEVPVYKGDWFVFNVANDRLRWNGSYYFAAAGMTFPNAIAFQSKVGDRHWSYCDEVDRVSRFIADPRDHGNPVQSISTPWDQGNDRIKGVTSPAWSGDPVWGRSRLTWIKFVAE